MILSHKFEYGYNPDGGRRLASMEIQKRNDQESN